MYIKQNISILFWRMMKKMNRNGKVPIYVRLTIDGLKEERSTKIWIDPEHWDNKTKQVLSADSNAKALNDELSDTKSDLKRHYDILKAGEGLVTPLMVFEAYYTPVRADRIKEEKVKNLQLSDTLDQAIRDCVDYYEAYKKAYKNEKTPHPTRLALLAERKKKLDDQVESLTKKANDMFDNTKWVKTLTLAINEHLLYFLRMTLSDHRSFNTLEKMWVKKRRTIEFLEYRYKVTDIPLIELSNKHCEEYKVYNMTMRKTSNNTAMRYIQSWKETLNRCLANDWIEKVPWPHFKVKYDDTDAQWMTPEQMRDFIVQSCESEMIEIVRDVYVSMSFTGLAYADVYDLKPDFIMKGFDGKQWISKDRQKTDGDETLPLLPIVLELLEKYRNHPVSLRKGKSFPVPTNQAFNRILKTLCANVGFKLKRGKGSHTARYYFANEVTYNNGVPTSTIRVSLGQKSDRAVNTYVRPNKKNVSESMQMVEQKLFTNGKLNGLPVPPSVDPEPVREADCNTASNGAKVIQVAFR